jgi:hypothetical protein
MTSWNLNASFLPNDTAAGGGCIEKEFFTKKLKQMFHFCFWICYNRDSYFEIAMHIKEVNE